MINLSGSNYPFLVQFPIVPNERAIEVWLYLDMLLKGLDTTGRFFYKGDTLCDFCAFLLTKPFPKMGNLYKSYFISLQLMLGAVWRL